MIVSGTDSTGGSGIDSDGQGPLDPRCFIGIRELPERTQWKDVYKLDREKLKEALRSIAVMNLKKSPGGASADNRALAKAVSP
jgi:hypothetical protein